jgi:hypothetical protein
VLLLRLAGACVAQDGDVQLWGVQAGGMLDTLPGGAGDEEVTAVEPIQAAPYLLLGTRGGAVRVAALLGESGSPDGGAREACSLAPTPHKSARPASGQCLALHPALSAAHVTAGAAHACPLPSDEHARFIIECCGCASLS